MTRKSNIEKLIKIGFNRYNYIDTSNSIGFQCGDALCDLKNDGTVDICLKDITVKGNGESLEGALTNAIEQLNTNTKQARTEIKKLLSDLKD